MEKIELKLFNEEEASKLSKEEIISTVLLSYEIEAMLFGKGIFLRSIFIDGIAKAILDEQKNEQEKSGENNGK